VLIVDILNVECCDWRHSGSCQIQTKRRVAQTDYPIDLFKPDVLFLHFWPIVLSALVDVIKTPKKHSTFNTQYGQHSCIDCLLLHNLKVKILEC